MEDKNTSQNTIFNGNRQPLPNATAVLILGIISIVACCCYSIPGVICSVIAIVLGNKDLKLYYSNPTAFTQSSLNNLKAGRVCAIIALVLSILFLVFIIYTFSVIGLANMGDPDKVKEIMHQRYGI